MVKNKELLCHVRICPEHVDTRGKERGRSVPVRKGAKKNILHLLLACGIQNADWIVPHRLICYTLNKPLACPFIVFFLGSDLFLAV